MIRNFISMQTRYYFFEVYFTEQIEKVKYHKVNTVYHPTLTRCQFVNWLGTESQAHKQKSKMAE